jgi:hypothetical protein
MHGIDPVMADSVEERSDVGIEDPADTAPLEFFPIK